MTIIGGIAAGILGLTGFKGILFYVLLYITTSFLIIVRMNDNFSVAKFVPKTTAASFLYSGLVGETLAFVLYWTLFYALVHIY
jgi:hypothetical protein